MVNTLKEWWLARPGNDLVFGNGRGNVESPANIWNRRLAPAQIAAGVIDGNCEPKYGLHAFRHFFASRLIDQASGRSECRA